MAFLKNKTLGLVQNDFKIHIFKTMYFLWFLKTLHTDTINLSITALAWIRYTDYYSECYTNYQLRHYIGNRIILEHNNASYLHFGSMSSGLCYNPSCSWDKLQTNSTLSDSQALQGHCARCTTSQASGPPPLSAG